MRRHETALIPQEVAQSTDMHSSLLTCHQVSNRYTIAACKANVFKYQIDLGLALASVEQRHCDRIVNERLVPDDGDGGSETHSGWQQQSIRDAAQHRSRRIRMRASSS